MSSDPVRALFTFMLLTVALAGTVMRDVSPVVAQEQEQQQQQPVGADTAAITITVSSTGALDGATLEQSLRPVIGTAVSELQSLFSWHGPQPLGISFGTAPDPLIQQQWQSIGTFAWLDPAAGQALVDLDQFARLSPIEAGNVVRNLIARDAFADLTGGSLAAGLNDGLAAYFERPVLAEQARRGSLVQQVELAQQLPPVVSIVNAAPTLLDDYSRAALHYAFVAFLIDHYGIASLQQLVTASGTAANWQAALETATAQSIAQIDEAWGQFLPRWYSGGWQFNAFNGFDMTAAQGLFDRGAYSSAIALAEDSQVLFTEIGDPVRLAQVEAFITLGAIGVRAEELMKDVQASLEHHDYVQSDAKLIAAEEQYAYLPESHKPVTLIRTWRGIIDTGLAAAGNAARAQSLAADWSKTREARDLALTAGNGFAAIGDTDQAAITSKLVTDLNQRLQRITLAAIAVVVLVAVWLLVWLWSRAPTRFRWSDRLAFLPPSTVRKAWRW